MVLCFDPEPVIPCKGVPNDKATENVVRADYTDDSESEEGESYPKRQERLVVDQSGKSQRSETITSFRTHCFSSLKRRTFLATYPIVAPMIQDRTI